MADKTVEYRRQFLSPDAADEYDSVQYAEGTYADLLYRIEKNEITKIIESVRQRKTKIESLDFACGTGRLSVVLEGQVDRNEGLDISSAMLEHAKAKATRTTFDCGDITRQPDLAPGPFDLIVTFRFVTNSEPELHEAALKALRHRLRDADSRLVFNIHRNFHSYLFIKWLVARLRPGKGSVNWHYMSMRQARSMARRCGLDVEKTVGFGLLSSHLAKVLPFNVALKMERMLSRVPGLGFFGVEFIMVCKPAKN